MFHHLSELAVSQPQADFAALTKCLQCEWICYSWMLFILTETLRTSFFACTEIPFSLPVQFGIMCISVPTESAAEITLLAGMLLN